MTKKHVSLLVVFVLLFTTLFTGFVFAADEEWVVADEITINVAAHIQTFGDQTYTGKGMVAFGTEGKAKRLEKFNITLEGAPADMELVGMAHVQSYGDMPKTGLQAGAIGTSGQAKRIEGVAFQLVKKGTNTPYPGYRVKYAVHMQSFGWGVSDKVNEVVGKNFNGYDDMVVGPSFAGTKGLYKRVESVSLIIERVKELKVTNVAALNAKQLQVTFSAPVDADTIYDANGDIVNNSVTVTQVNGSAVTVKGSLSADGKTLTLTASSALTKDAYYNVVINGVKNANADAVPAYSQIVKMDEAVAPAIKTITSVTKDEKTRVTTFEFTEPVQFNSIKIDGRFAASVGTADSGFGAKWTVVAASDLEAGKTYNVEVNGLVDLLGNRADNIVTSTVTVVRDNIKPTFTLTPAGEKAFNIVFNKEMSATVNVDSIIVTKNVNGTDITLTQAGLATRNSDKKSFRVNLASVPFDTSSQNEREIKVAVKGLSDTLGNTMDAATATLVLVRDKEKPTLVSVVQKPGTQNVLVAQFSESVAPVAGGTLNSQITNIFKIVDDNGKDVYVGGSLVTISAAGALSWDNKVELTLSNALPSTGTYRLVLVQNTVKDTAQIANTNEAKVVSFSYNKAATTITQLTATITATYGPSGVTASGTPAERKITVTFNRDDVINGIDNATGTYKVGAADNPANYTIDGSALPVGTAVNFINGTPDKVELDFSGVEAWRLPASLTTGGTIAVAVSNVRTAQGSTIAYTTTSLQVKDTTAPTVSAAYLSGDVSENSLRLTLVFSENVNVSAINLTKILLKGKDSADANVSYNPAAKTQSTANRTVVEFTFATGLELDVTKAVKLEILTANGVTDEADPAVALAATTEDIAITNYATN